MLLHYAWLLSQPYPQIQSKSKHGEVGCAHTEQSCSLRAGAFSRKVGACWSKPLHKASLRLRAASHTVSQSLGEGKSHCASYSAQATLRKSLCAGSSLLVTLRKSFRSSDPLSFSLSLFLSLSFSLWLFFVYLFFFLSLSLILSRSCSFQSRDAKTAINT